MFKERLKKWLYSKGYEVRSASSVPFGVDWHRDLKCLLMQSGEEIKTVFDVGANTGQTAGRVANAFRESKIYCFEPSPRTFKQLEQNVRGMAGVTAINCALGERVGHAEMLEKSESQNSTLLVAREKSRGGEQGNTISVNVETIDAFCVRYRIERIDLLKIDTEGFEMAVLRGAREMLAQKRINWILAECEFQERREGDRHGDFVEMLGFLTGFNFSVVSFYTQGVDQHGWIWGDVLFRLKRPAPPRGYTYSPHVGFVGS